MTTGLPVREEISGSRILGDNLNKKIDEYIGSTKNIKRKREVRTSLYTCSGRSEFRSRDLEVFNSVKKLADYLFDFEYESRVSLDNSLYVLSTFCNFVSMSPDEIILLDNESLEKNLKAFHKSLVDRGLSLKTARTAVYYVKTFLKCNEIVLNIKMPKMPPRYRKRPEYPPTPQEVKKMMDFAGSLKNAAIVGVLGFSGLRNSTLRALQFGVCPDPNFPDYSIRRQLGQSERVLAIVVHREMKRKVKRGCKGKIPYFTFVPEFVTEKLRAYSNSEYTRLGKIDDEAFLFPSFGRKFPMEKRPFTPLTDSEIRYIVKLAAKNAGLPQWQLVTPLSLRKTFKMWLINQPEAVRLPFEDNEFLMGHILPGNIDEYYDKTRTRIEELREKFSKLVISEANYNKQVAQSVCALLNIDFSPEYEELKKKLGREPLLSEIGEIVRQKRSPKQILAPIGDVPKLLKEGWRWVDKYDDAAAILEKAF